MRIAAKSDKVTVYVFPEPVATSSGKKKTKYFKDVVSGKKANVTFTGANPDGEFYYFNLYREGNSTAIQRGLNSPNFSVSGEGCYYINGSYSTAGGLSTGAGSELICIKKLTLSLTTFNSSIALPSGGNIDLIVSAVCNDANRNISYQWSKDGVDISAATGRNYTATTTGIYTLTTTVTDDSTPPQTITKTISIKVIRRDCSGCDNPPGNPGSVAPLVLNLVSDRNVYLTRDTGTITATATRDGIAENVSVVLTKKNNPKINFEDGKLTANGNTEKLLIGKDESTNKEDITITATAYDSKKQRYVTATIKITVIKLGGISYKGPKMKKFKDVELSKYSYKMIPSFKDKKFDYKVYYTPDTVNVEDAATISWSSSFGASGSGKEWKKVNFSQTGNHTITRTVMGNEKTYTVVMKAKVEEKPSFTIGEQKYAEDNWDETLAALNRKILPTPDDFDKDKSFKANVLRKLKIAPVYYDDLHVIQWIRTREEFNKKNLVNAKSDAFRHAATAMLLVKYTKKKYAIGIMTRHEAKSKLMTDDIMDLYNNEVGYSTDVSALTSFFNSYKKNRENIFEHALSLVKNGKLLYLDEPHGVGDILGKGLLQPTNKP